METDPNDKPADLPDPGFERVVPTGGKKLFAFGVMGVAALAAFYAYNANVGDPFHLQLGLAILVLGCAPALIWARRAANTYPIFETFMLTTVNTYAIPLLSGHHALGEYLPEDISSAAQGVLLFQAVAIATYLSIRGEPKRTFFWRQPIINEKTGRYLTYGLALTVIYTLISNFYRDALFSVIPYELEGVLRAVFFGIGIIATFLGARRWGEGTLARGDKIFYGLALVLQVVLQCSSLYLIGSVSLLVLAALGYVSASHRLPLVTMIVATVLLGLLHNGKSAMREIYWFPEPRHVELTRLPSFYVRWVEFGLQRDSEEEDTARTAPRLLERTSLFHIMCLVVSVTPERQDFLHGETYAHVASQFIPRFFWPEKPRGHVSTHRLSTYYGLQQEEQTAVTTIAFGTLTEAYANFGYFGLGGLAFLYAFIYRKISLWSAESPLMSFGGLLVVVLIAWSFQVELTLSIWLTSLFQALVAVLGIPFFIRRLGN